MKRFLKIINGIEDFIDFILIPEVIIFLIIMLCFLSVLDETLGYTNNIIYKEEEKVIGTVTDKQHIIPSKEVLNLSDYFFIDFVNVTLYGEPYNTEEYEEHYYVTILVETDDGVEVIEIFDNMYLYDLTEVGYLLNVNLVSNFSIEGEFINYTISLY